MGYTLLVDDKTLDITSFNESLDSMGNLTFSVSADNIDLSKTSFTGLNDIKEAMADNEIGLKIKDENGKVVWQSDEYSLSNASFNATATGAYFSAHFTTSNGIGMTSMPAPMAAPAPTMMP